MSTDVRGWLRREGGWVPADALPLTDRAVRYGMAVFETIGIRDGRPLFFEEHARLLAAAAARMLATEIEPDIPPLRADDRGMLRLYITAGDGGPADAVDGIRVFALFEPSSGELPERQAARLNARPVAPFAGGDKTSNYWMQCAAQAAARADGFDHALLFDHEGLLLGGAMGNVFFTIGDELCTPAISPGVRPGVLRSWVMGQRETREIEFPAWRMDEVVEIFLTNSRLGVMPLQLGKTGPGPVGCSLRDRCRREKIIP